MFRFCCQIALIFDYKMIPASKEEKG